MQEQPRSLVDTPVFSKSGTFEQVDHDNGIAYGFAIVCTIDGEAYFDLQDDHIPEDVMTEAAVEFFQGSRAGKDQHRGEQVADLVFGMPMTKAIQNAEGITCRKTGLWIGYKPQDPVQLDMIASGERTGFSIGGVLLDSETAVGKAVWSSAYQDALPDSAFLFVKAGGKKDKEGRTAPRANRMFPVRDKDGKVDKAHVTNALSRVDKSRLADAEKASVRAAAQKLLAEVDKSQSALTTQAAMLAVAKGYSSADPKKKGRVFRAFKMFEISLVDRPAQEPATVSVVKSIRKVDLSKDVVLTSVDSGHQHVLSLDDCGEYWSTSYATSSAETANDASHSHRVVVLDGKVTIADNAGHGHSVTMPDDWTPPVRDSDEPPQQPGVEVVTVTASAPRAEPAQVPEQKLTDKNARDSVPNMTDAEIKALQDENSTLRAQLAKANKLVELTQPQREFYTRLDSISGPAFLAKSAAERQVELDGSVIGKAADGVTYYRGQEQLWSLVQSNESLKKSVEEQRQLVKAAEISKRADAYRAMPGDDPTRVAVVLAIDSISDEKVRKAAFDMLAGGSAACDYLAKAQGHQHVTEQVQNVNDAYYKGVAEFAKSASLPYVTETDRAKASLAFMKTHEGAQLYKSVTEEQDRAARAR